MEEKGPAKRLLPRKVTAKASSPFEIDGWKDVILLLKWSLFRCQTVSPLLEDVWTQMFFGCFETGMG